MAALLLTLVRCSPWVHKPLSKGDLCTVFSSQCTSSSDTQKHLLSLITASSQWSKYILHFLAVICCMKFAFFPTTLKGLQALQLLANEDEILSRHQKYFLCEILLNQHSNMKAQVCSLEWLIEGAAPLWSATLRPDTRTLAQIQWHLCLLRKTNSKQYDIVYKMYYCIPVYL